MESAYDEVEEMEAVGDLSEETENTHTDVEQEVLELAVFQNELNVHPIILDPGEEVTKITFAVFVEDLVVGSMKMQELPSFLNRHVLDFLCQRVGLGYLAVGIVLDILFLDFTRVVPPLLL